MSPSVGASWPLISWHRNIFARRASPSLDQTRNPSLVQMGSRCWEASVMRARSSTGWPAAGRTGERVTVISTRRKMRRLFMTSCATCWPVRWRHRIPRSGSTQACTTPMDCLVLPKGTTMWTQRPRKWSRRRMRSSTRKFMPASSSRSRMTWSMRAGSWICGPAKRGSSSTAQALGRISPSCGARTNRSPEEASRPG